jgi:hypothetical protein
LCQRTGDESREGEDISGRELEKLDILFGADVLSTQSIKAPDVVNGINESIVKKDEDSGAGKPAKRIRKKKEVLVDVVPCFDLFNNLNTQPQTFDQAGMAESLRRVI